MFGCIILTIILHFLTANLQIVEITFLWILYMYSHILCTHCIHSFAIGNLILYPLGLSIWCVDFRVETKIPLKVILFFFKLSTHAPGYWGTRETIFRIFFPIFRREILTKKETGSASARAQSSYSKYISHFQYEFTSVLRRFLKRFRILTTPRPRARARRSMRGYWGNLRGFGRETRVTV